MTAELPHLHHTDQPDLDLQARLDTFRSFIDETSRALSQQHELYKLMKENASLFGADELRLLYERIGASALANCETLTRTYLEHDAPFAVRHSETGLPAPLLGVTGFAADESHNSYYYIAELPATYTYMPAHTQPLHSDDISATE